MGLAMAFLAVLCLALGLLVSRHRGFLLDPAAEVLRSGRDYGTSVLQGGMEIAEKVGGG
jgi:hypothetical protein